MNVGVVVQFNAFSPREQLVVKKLGIRRKLGTTRSAKSRRRPLVNREHRNPLSACFVRLFTCNRWTSNKPENIDSY